MASIIIVITELNTNIALSDEEIAKLNRDLPSYAQVDDGTRRMLSYDGRGAAEKWFCSDHKGRVVRDAISSDRWIAACAGGDGRKRDEHYWIGRLTTPMTAWREITQDIISRTKSQWGVSNRAFLTDLLDNNNR